jgi:catechol 2,3-dioxygenase-like lactoylglutathione lyase family enzyme
VITGLDHIVFRVRDLEAAIAAYQRLLGLEPAWRTRADGVGAAVFTRATVSLEFLAPDGDGPVGDRVRAALDAGGERPVSLSFRAEDLARLHRRLNAVGLQPEPIEPFTSRADDGRTLAWTRTRAGCGTHGIRHFFLQLAETRPASPAIAASPIEALERVVIRTPDPDRAAALYGARLGLDMRFDGPAPGDGRLLFFRCGDLILEVLHVGERGDGPDEIWGLSWRSNEIAATHERLAAAGFSLSEVRAGRGAGTEIFTVRDGTLGIPTVVLKPSPPWGG